MIPVCLVTGFLGSGKTTLLKRIVDQYRGRRLVYLVNDFAAAEVDAQLIEAGSDVVSIAGGSIFCKCLVTHFIRQMEEIHGRFHTPDHPVEGLVIEASGVADPRVIRRMLRETRLEEHFALGAVVSVVDPQRFLKLRHTLPNILAQVEAATVVLLNKADACSAEELEATRASVSALAPDARVVVTRYCEADLDLFGPTPAPSEPAGNYAACRDPRYATWSLAVTKPVDLLSLKRLVDGLGDDLFRLKGWVPAAEGSLYVDVSGRDLTTRRCAAPDGGAHRLVVIGSGDARARIEEALSVYGAVPADQEP